MQLGYLVLDYGPGVRINVFDSGSRVRRKKLMDYQLV